MRLRHVGLRRFAANPLTFHSHTAPFNCATRRIACARPSDRSFAPIAVYACSNAKTGCAGRKLPASGRQPGNPNGACGALSLSRLGAGPPRIALEGGAARFCTQQIEPFALAPRPVYIGFLVALGAQSRRDGPPIAAPTRAGQLHGMSHSIVTPVTHAPSTLDLMSTPPARSILFEELGVSKAIVMAHNNH